MTPEDLYAFRFVTDAQISPDGARVAYVVREVDRDKDGYRSAIWLAPFGGGPGARLTYGPGQDALPRWSPDSKRIAFASDRGAGDEGKKRKPKNVFVLGLDGGEARQVTTFEDDCGDLVWSPDGTRVAFTMKDPKGKDAPEDGGIRVFDRMRYKTDEGFMLDGRRKHVWIADVAAGGARRLTDGDWDDLQPSWSPDGSMIAFVSNRTDDREKNTVADIHVAQVSGGGWRVTDGTGSYGNPRFSPDGATIACYGVATAIGSSAKNVRVFTFPMKGGAGSDITGEWDRTVGSTVMSDMRSQSQTLPPTWSADRSRILFVGSDQGTANVYSVSLKEHDVRAETMGPHQIVSLSLGADGKRFACVYATAVLPGDVATGELGKTLKTVTDVNGELLRSRAIVTPERVEFTGADGWKIEGWLMKPRGFDPAKKWPLVLEVHGGPHGAYGHGFFHEFQVLAGRGYAVLYTNPRGSHAYGEKFATACVGDWGGKDYEDLMAGVDHALSLGWVDPKRLYVTGGSYGGFMTNWIVGHTDRFRAAATQRSISNNVSAFGTSDIGWHFWEYEHGDATPWGNAKTLVERSPLMYAPKVKTPLLILHAERDLRCPIEQAEQFFIALRWHGVETQFVRFPDDNHDLTRGGKPRNRVEHSRRIADWFDAHP